MLAHAEIVIAAPDGDAALLAIRTMPQSGWELPRKPLELDEGPIAAIQFHFADESLELGDIVHASTSRARFPGTLCEQVGAAHRPLLSLVCGCGKLRSRAISSAGLAAWQEWVVTGYIEEYLRSGYPIGGASVRDGGDTVATVRAIDPRTYECHLCVDTVVKPSRPTSATSA
jgi:hypothetical protein